MKKVRRIHLWTAIIAGIGEGASNVNAGYSTTTSYHYNTYGGRNGRTYYTTSQHVTYNAYEAARQRAMSAERLANLNYAQRMEYSTRNEGYLKRTTIFPGEHVRGFINIKRTKDMYMVNTFVIDGADYEFSWKVRE